MATIAIRKGVTPAHPKRGVPGCFRARAGWRFPGRAPLSPPQRAFPGSSRAAPGCRLPPPPEGVAIFAKVFSSVSTIQVQRDKGLIMGGMQACRSYQGTPDRKRQRKRPERDRLSNEGRSARRKCRAVGELPKARKFGKSLGLRNAEARELRQRGLHRQGHQSKNEQRLRRRSILFLSPVVAIFHGPASVTLAFSRGGRCRIDEAATLEKIQPR
jgi:hypothetical protein